ncbi:MAG: OmpA family protein [Flavobacteriales bacterium]
MRGTLRHVLACLLVAGSAAALAQCEPEEPRSAKAQKLYERATSPKGKASLEDRLAWLEEALELSPEDPELLMESAEMTFKATRRDPDMWGVLSERLNALDEVCPGGMPEVLYLRGATAYLNDDYENALMQFKAYLALPEEVTKRIRRREAAGAMPELTFLHQYYMHADRPAPSPISEVSWDEDEYLPLLSPDGTLLFFTRVEVSKAKGDVTTTRKETFSWARRKDERLPFDGGVPLGEPFNLGSNYGGATISVDNKLMVIAAHRPVPGNPANIDLFSTEYHVDYRDLDGQFVYMWSPLEPLGVDVNTTMGWEAQPSISGDGTTLFFAAARAESTPDADGNLTMDLFSAPLRDNGTWGPVVKLPAPVNSAFQDKSPFLHPDGRTLYFSSNREPSGGGYDLWMSQRDSSGTWSEPVNLGLPLNSSGDEHGLIVSTDGTEGIFASRRRGTRGLDLCAYALPEELKPDPVTVVKGDLGWPVPDGELTVSIEYVQSRRVEQVQYSREDGQFAHVVKLAEGEDVVLTVQGEHVGYQSRVVHQEGKPTGGTVKLDLNVQESAFDSGASSGSSEGLFELQDVQFDTKKSTLDPRSEIVLRALANHMGRTPDLRLDIDGHTDDVGDAADNLILSQARAKAVKVFLAACGVEEHRMTTRGHGESLPKTSNTTEAGRSLNRRTEFRWVD